MTEELADIIRYCPNYADLDEEGKKVALELVYKKQYKAQVIDIDKTLKEIIDKQIEEKEKK